YKYDITKSLKINYFMSSIETRHNRIYVNINDDKFSFNNIIVPLENVLAFLVILYLIRNNINEIDFEIIKNILCELERLKK
ncbi:MAG: hypothetical protein K2J20_00485, partial [Bacilli bacterium]|nr:hypothetical protein [Bacilli bacterium]